MDIGQLINWKFLNTDRVEFKTQKENKVTKNILLLEMCHGKNNELMAILLDLERTGPCKLGWNTFWKKYSDVPVFS